VRTWVVVGVTIALAAALFGACSSGSGESELLRTDLGGETTTNALNMNAFSLPAANLPGEDRGRFEVGDSFFTQNWVAAPASTTNRDGLGPTFNARACAGCHVRDGRGAPPNADTDLVEAPGLLVRISVPGTGPHGEPQPDPNYGEQIQDVAIIGVPAEARISVTYTPVTGRYADGTEYVLSRPTYRVVDPMFGPLPANVLLSPRIAPQVIGMGLLETIPEADIRAAALHPPSDEVSGRVNIVYDAVADDMRLGRFGWKANVPTVEQQVAGAFIGDLGITNPLFRAQNCPVVQVACAAAIPGGDPEIEGRSFDTVVFYSQVLAVPARRPLADADRDAQGSKVFERIGCAACHTPTQRSGPSTIPALAEQTFHPFTDLLLHDMGAELADGRPDFDASESEWRTPPLWGLGLVQKINPKARFLHDGRAATIEEAVLWHGGEAAPAQKRFRELSREDREALLAYLETL